MMKKLEDSSENDDACSPLTVSKSYNLKNQIRAQLLLSTKQTWLPGHGIMPRCIQRTQPKLAWTTSVPPISPFSTTAKACSEPPSRYVPRRAVLRALAVLSLPLSGSARAICGAEDPFFAHFVEWQENMAGASSGRAVHYRIVGSKKKEEKAKKLPVLYIGDAGAGITAGETLELLCGTDRRLVCFDMLGVGDSTPFNYEQRSNDDLKSEAVLEARGVLKSTGLDRSRFHVVGAGFGLGVAEQLIEEGLPVASVVAEAWSWPSSGSQLSFKELQGDRICAKEAAEAGDVKLLNAVYRSRNKGGKESIRSIARRVPTLALRRDGEDAIGKEPSLREAVLSAEDRLLHLSATEPFIRAADDFFGVVEDAKNNE